MAHEFDYKQYNKYIDSMVRTLDDMNDPQIFDKLHKQAYPIIELFGIALLSNDYSEYVGTRGVHIKEIGLPPEARFGEPNLECEVAISKVVNDTVAVKLMAYPYVDKPVWDDETKELIRSFLEIYFHLIARVRIFHLFNDRVFHDQDMPFVGNIRSLMRDLSRIRMMGKLTQYSAYRLNISNFSRYNRSFGRKNADEIMNQYIGGLAALSDELGGVYRLGGDNFVGVVPIAASTKLHKYLLGKDIKINDDFPEVNVCSRAGIYNIDDNNVVPDLIIKRISHSFAKTNSKNRVIYFDAALEKMEEEEDKIENEFLDAIKNGKVVPYYQPKVNVADSRIVGAEALCRWERKGDLVTPNVFIPIIERTNQIGFLDFYMLQKVCENIRDWIDAGHTPIPISVNFSRNNLADKKFVKKIIEVIDKYNIPHELIIIELTETTLEVDFEELVVVVEELRKNKVRAAVDDFGMGYSSLNLIKDIQWDILKIDKSFVPDRSKPTFERYFAMLRNVVRMADDINMPSVIEGVETKEQLDLAVTCGCRIVQGFYYDKPLERTVFESKLLGTFKGQNNWRY